MIAQLKQILIRNKPIILGVCIYILFASFLISIRKDLWYDELFTLEVIKSDLTRFINLVIGDGKPPLYYLFIKIYYLVLNTDAANLLRISSIILGIPFIIYTWKIIEIFVKGKFRYLIFILLFLNPLFLVYSTELRMYSMLASSTLIYLYYFYRYHISKQDNSLTKLRVARLLVISTSYIGIFYFLAEIIYRIINDNLFDIRKPFVTIRKILQNYKIELISFLLTCTLVATQIIIFPNFNPFWVDKFNLSSIPNTVGVVIFGTDPGIAGKSRPFIINTLMTDSDIGKILWPIIYISITSIIILGIWRLLRKHSSDAKNLLLFVLLIFLLITLSSQPFMPVSFYQERYLIGISLSSLLLILIILEQSKIQSFKLISFLIILSYTAVYISLGAGVIKFAKPPSSDSEYIKYYYTEELNRCGITVFEKSTNKCLGN